MIVDLTMLANLPVVVAPDEAQAPRSRKAPARPPQKRKAKKASASRPEREGSEQEDAGEEDRR